MQQSSAAAFSTISPAAPLPGYRRPRIGLGPSHVGIRCRWRSLSLACRPLFFPSSPLLCHAGPLPGRWVTAVRAASDGESKAGSEALVEALQLVAFFALWYIFNIYFNIYNKQVLEVYPFPITITAFQVAIGTALAFLMWSTNLYKRPKLSYSQIVAILPLVIFHALGNLFTNMSLGKVAVSFTHTIKAMEPFFTVILSALFFGELPNISVFASLVPIVAGVVLASFTEASFNWPGFWSAMASNLTNQSRNVISKKFMVKKEESLDNINLFSIITIMSFFLLAPLALFMEGIKFTPSYVYSAGLNLKEIYVRSLLAALCFHAYQQISYMILARVSPVTHSVGNCAKRVVVIVASVLFFRIPLSPINCLGIHDIQKLAGTLVSKLKSLFQIDYCCALPAGTGLALAGVFLYSRVKSTGTNSA